MSGNFDHSDLHLWAWQKWVAMHQACMQCSPPCHYPTVVEVGQWCDSLHETSCVYPVGHYPPCYLCSSSMTHCIATHLFYLHHVWLIHLLTFLKTALYLGWVSTTDIQERSQNLRHFYPGTGLKLGYLGFSRDQNICNSSGVYELLSEHERCMVQKIVDTFCLHVSPYVWSAKLWIPPNLIPMADDAITRSDIQDIRGLGSPLYIMWFPQKTAKWVHQVFKHSTHVTVENHRIWPFRKRKTCQL